ncbi:hypothetical protein N0V94_000280 [Neodidymelliopsis sp. IMI 364377]|nr:hypothetical protein N0V94_000280 [Neodidymelliopsis sp. IMI 364377]
MVLRDVENSAPDSFTDNPSPSDNDPYASPSTGSAGERYDASAMPQPIPLIGPLIGFSSRALRFKADTTLQFAEKKLGRVLHPEEAQALAYHIYKLEKNKSYYAAAGAAGGVYRWYATMSTYQYPFYKPKVESIDVNRFGLIKGPAANLARHTWRFGLYALVAGQMGNIIGQLISQPIAAYETSIDPKLEQFGAEIKAASGNDQRANEQRARTIEERRKEFEARQRQEKTGGMTPPYGSRGQDRRQAPPLASGGDDDMSPTAGNEAWGTSAPSFDGFAPDEARPKPQRQPAPSSRRQSPYQSTSSSSSPFDDDASPTGGLFYSETTNPDTNTNAQSAPSARPGESSWERLRRGASSASSSSQGPSQAERIQRFASSSRQHAEGSTVGDNFTFAEGREQRDVERERAQREFDERLERERQGGDFNEGGGKKW